MCVYIYIYIYTQHVSSAGHPERIEHRLQCSTQFKPAPTVFMLSPSHSDVASTSSNARPSVTCHIYKLRIAGFAHGPVFLALHRQAYHSYRAAAPPTAVASPAPQNE